MGAQDLIHRVLTTHAIMEVSRYDFDMSSLIVTPKHVKLSYQEEELRCIAGLKDIEKPFKVVNIQ